jgi:hypothetical protein
MNKPLKYIALGILLWIGVDFTTTAAIKDPGYYYSHFMPALLLFYLGHPLLFSLLIYKFKLNSGFLFIATLLGAFVVEILFTRNALLYTFPMMLLAIPVAIAIYSLLTFLPKWLVEGEIYKQKWQLTIMLIVYILVSLATILSNNSLGT